eukprot:snap_masked-scaffold_17-processed-gene-1.10-mRNA-1 protein AED:1.00 eAED:1.00 QI:0/0/0/0/1/1/2/0/117
MSLGTGTKVTKFSPMFCLGIINRTVWLKNLHCIGLKAANTMKKLQFKDDVQLNWILIKLKEVYGVNDTFQVNNYVGFEIRDKEKEIHLTAENYILELVDVIEIEKDEIKNIPHVVNY